MEAEIVRAGYERKYLVPELSADTLLGMVSELLPPDPHGATYRVASLYFDSPDWVSYHRVVPGKWRLRRYGTGDTVFAEYKAKPAPGSVHKRSSALTTDESLNLETSGKPGWFVKAIEKNQLKPVLMVSYERHAFVGTLDGEEVRLTLDRHLCADRCTEIAVPSSADNGLQLTDARILEVKFGTSLPIAIAHILESLDLAPESFSKYRCGIDTIYAPEPLGGNA